MKFVHKSLGLLLASLALASCGGGGGDGNSFTSPPQSGSITLTPAGNSTVLPLNVGGASPYFVGSPYANEVDIHWTNADGSPVSGHDVSCSISNLSVASIHVLDDATTDDIDESQQAWGNIQVHSDTGHAVCFVFSEGESGQATLTVGGVDPITSATISKSLTFTVQAASAALPATVEMTAQPPGVYFSGSNGNQTSVLSIQVLDGGAQPVPNPTSGNGGADNVLLEIVTNPAGGARLSANSVAGSVSGPSVATHTVNGIATASFQSGDVQGPIQIRATSDRSDNNVTNGISDPVSTTFSVIVSDGKLFAIQITSPDTNAILANSVSGNVETDDNGIPPDPDATYSLTVSALATDRQGAPVLPGTPVRFGSIDEPAGAFNAGASANRFVLSGNDGNPQEGGTQFTAPTGQFQTAGGGAGPGDALIVFGKTQHGAPAGNEDLESAVTIANVTSQTSLNVNTPFNRNDTTGALTDHGPVLPYVIGRSNHGNITATATTNDIGVAHATLNYTASTLGHIVAMWAQGDGIDNLTNGARRVTDATELLYPGIAPASLTAFPTPIPGNTPQPVTVTVCLVDALSSPIQGITISYQMQLGGGTGSVDGNGPSGTLDNVTGPDGCVDASVTTSGIPPGQEGGTAGQIIFGAGDATATVDIMVQLAFLQASPAQVCPGGVVNISAISSTGAPASGVSISSGCGTTPATGLTGQSGVAAFRINADTAAGTCTFTADDFGLSVSVQVGGINTSPPCAGGS